MEKSKTIKSHKVGNTHFRGSIWDLSETTLLSPMHPPDQRSGCIISEEGMALKTY